MNPEKNGGPAFPQKEPMTHDWHGASLRDYFAAKAMIGICSAEWSSSLTNFGIAAEAYSIADAMLQARGAA